MWGSRSKCLVERDLSGLWAPDSALPPLLSESAPAHSQAGPSNRFEGLCPFAGHLPPHGGHTFTAPTDRPGVSAGVHRLSTLPE